MMNREKAIHTIRGSFSANSEYIITKEVGKKLLWQSICDCWDCLPDEILNRYAQLCIYNDKILRDLTVKDTD